MLTLLRLWLSGLSSNSVRFNRMLLCGGTIVNLKAAHDAELTNVKIDTVHRLHGRAAIEPIPDLRVKFLRQVDDVANQIVARLNVKVCLLGGSIPALSLQSGDVAHGYQEAIIVLSRRVDKMLIVG